MSSVRIEIELNKEWIPLTLTLKDADDATRKAKSISENARLSTRVVMIDPLQKIREGYVKLLTSFQWEMKEMNYGYNGSEVEDVTISTGESHDG